MSFLPNISCINVVINFFENNYRINHLININYGPTFGAGHDLHIADQCKNSNNSCCNPSTYNEVKVNELSGEKNFMVENYEVYSVIFV